MRIWKAIFVLVLLFFGFLTVAFVKEARQGGKENLGEPEETPIERAVEDVFNALGLGSSLYADEAQSVSGESPADEPAAAALPVSAAEEEEAKGDAPAGSAGLNTLWVLIATFLVFFMQLGFMLVEAGFSRSKNAVNIMMKNVIDFAVGSLAFFAVGFGLMCPATTRPCHSLCVCFKPQGAGLGIGTDADLEARRDRSVTGRCARFDFRIGDGGRQ